ncbi:hypothetical protein ACUXKK_003515 [Klebsiella aerogenes]|nr:hypothetical protein P851_04849 [Klebsiella aerogenes UCI 48]EUL43884.1 hypothetical protein P850_04272 [Klebsiella aerogenes UCI 47]EUL47120.1 hypothetical protein P849_04341 [Klebsiella aerogenes UCI 46]EUL51488.1 hypothetical protein P848_04041 [Klebsiella aerogenes UCI 45]EUL81517.1 hypothetical protein P830_03762 [Klebsiella aerogenes UCI 27]EUL84641.1 hypothetical protein P831_00782 [Klebsiella aerogenes UCI 28]EUL92386.1 hypothetical protein P819_04597 [Klebsiella aerogenes UCI 16]
MNFGKSPGILKQKVPTMNFLSPPGGYSLTFLQHPLQLFLRVQPRHFTLFEP